MRCPRCTLADLNEATQTCALCGYSHAGGDDTALPALPATQPRTELDARRELTTNFRIESLLQSAAGPFTYLAQDAQGRPLILKAVPLTRLELPADRVLAALESAARLDHPHIVPVHDAGTTDHFLWYATRPVEGRSLGSSLGTAGPIELPVCLRMLQQIASAVDYAHRRGVTHGALGPECILVDANEWVLVGDFGSGGLLGSPETPPAASDGEGADQRALARLARQCLTGSSEGDGLTNGHPPLPLHVSQALGRAGSARQDDLFPSVLDFVAALGGGGGGGGNGEKWNDDPGPVWFSAKPRKGAGGPVVISDTDADPTASPWRKRVAAAAGVVLAFGAGAAWLNLSSVPAAPAGNVSALAPPPAAMPATVTVAPRADTAAPPRAVVVRPAPTAPAAAPPARLRPRPRPDPQPPPRPAPARAPAPSGTPVETPVDRLTEPALLSINAIPWGSVYVDGRPVGNTPLIDVTLSPGAHRLRVQRDGFRPYDRMIALASGQRLRITDIALVER
jgi:eukaryotic-like serine/threonine-protein kinase